MTATECREHRGTAHCSVIYGCRKEFLFNKFRLEIAVFALKVPLIDTTQFLFHILVRAEDFFDNVLLSGNAEHGYACEQLTRRRIFLQSKNKCKFLI